MYRGIVSAQDRSNNLQSQEKKWIHTIILLHEDVASE